jgi:anti-sigma factor RsiW
MDSNNTQTPVSEDDLHALLDGELPAAQRDAIESRLVHDASGAATLQAWRLQRDALRALHSEVLAEPIPPALLRAALQTQAAQQQVSQWWRWGGMAAGVVLAFGMGWLANGQLTRMQAGNAATIAKTQTGREFARQASVAHAVFSPEVRHPVEVAAAQQDHLVQWLSKRLGRSLKVPNLAQQGYELVGGRLLPGDEGARAQFMFQNTAGERVTLYVGSIIGKPAVTSKPGSELSQKETAFSFSSDGPVPGFYWVDQGFGYALAGKLPRETLVKLAEAVYQQL